MKRSYTYLKGLLTLALAALTGWMWAANNVQSYTFSGRAGNTEIPFEYPVLMTTDMQKSVDVKVSYTGGNHRVDIIGVKIIDRSITPATEYIGTATRTETTGNEIQDSENPNLSYSGTHAWKNVFTITNESGFIKGKVYTLVATLKVANANPSHNGNITLSDGVEFKVPNAATAEEVAAGLVYRWPGVGGTDSNTVVYGKTVYTVSGRVEDLTQLAIPSKNFTFSMWTKKSSNPNWNDVCGFADDTHQFKLEENKNGGLYVYGSAHGLNTDANPKYISAADFSGTELQLLTVVQENGTVKGYINGQLKMTTFESTAWANLKSDTAIMPYFAWGCSPTTGGTADRPLSISAADVCIFSYALTDEQVADLYEGYVSEFTTENITVSDDARLADLGLTEAATKLVNIEMATGKTLTIDGTPTFYGINILSEGDVALTSSKDALAGIALGVNCSQVKGIATYEESGYYSAIPFEKLSGIDVIKKTGDSDWTPNGDAIAKMGNSDLYLAKGSMSVNHGGLLTNVGVITVDGATLASTVNDPLNTGNNYADGLVLKKGAMVTSTKHMRLPETVTVSGKNNTISVNDVNSNQWRSVSIRKVVLEENATATFTRSEAMASNANAGYHLWDSEFTIGNGATLTIDAPLMKACDENAGGTTALTKKGAGELIVTAPTSDTDMPNGTVISVEAGTLTLAPTSATYDLGGASIAISNEAIFRVKGSNPVTMTQNISGEGTIVADGVVLDLTEKVTSKIAVENGGTLILPAGKEVGMTIPGGCTLVLKLSTELMASGYTCQATLNGTFGGFLDNEGVKIEEGVNGGTYAPENKVTWKNGAWNGEIRQGAILDVNFEDRADQTCEVALGDITSIGALQVSGVAGKIAISANNAVTIPIVAMNNTGAVEIASTQTININVTDKISGSGALTVTSGNISMTNAAVVATDYSGTLTLKNGVTLTWGNNSGSVVADTDYALGSSLVLESGSTFKPNLHTGKSLNKGKAGKMRLATTVALAGGTIEHPDGSYFYTKILVEEDSIININWDKGIAIERLLGDAALTIESKNTSYGCAFVSVWWTQDQHPNPTEWYTGTLKLKSASSTYNGGLPKMEFYPDTGDAFNKAHVQFLNGNVKYNMAGNSRCMGALSGAAADIVATGNPTLTIGGYAGADAVGAYEGTISGTNITLNNGATLTMTGTLGTLSDDIAIYEKAIALNANSHLKLGLAKKTILNGVISGSGALTVQSGAIELNAENTATGTITINAGATGSVNLTGAWDGDIDAYGVIAGTGSIGGKLKLQNGSTLDVSAGALNVTGEVWVMNGATNTATVKLPTEYAVDTPIVSCSNAETVAADLSAKMPADYKCIADGNTVELALATVTVTLPGAPDHTKWWYDGAEVTNGKITFVPGQAGELILKADTGYIFADGSTSMPVTINGTTVTTPDVTAATPVAEANGKQYQTLDAAIAAAQTEGTVKLLANVDITTFVTINKSITLDLDGKSITRTDATDNSTALYVNAEGVIVTITGEGTVTADHAVYVNAGTVIIENGTFEAGSHAVYVQGKGNAVIEGGTFSSEDGQYHYVLNEYDATRDATSIVVKGGKFEGFNPANNEAEGANTNFCAEGHIAVVGEGEEAGYYVVVEIPETAVAMIGKVDYDTLAGAIAAAQAGQTITLVKDITASEIITIEKAITLDGNGKTLTSTAGRAINIDCAGAVTIKNLTIDAGERAINIINQAAKVTINGVTATADNVAVMIATTAGAAQVSIEASNLTGLMVVGVYGAGAQVTIANSTIANVDANKNENYGAITVGDTADNATVEVSGTTITTMDDSKKAYNFNSTATITGVDQVGVVVAMIGEAGYDTIEEAAKDVKAGQTIVLVTDVETDEVLSITGTLDLNGKTSKGTILGKIAVNGGTYITAENVPVIGTNARAFETTDAVFTMDAVAGNITLNAGTVTAKGWDNGNNWTLPGQALVVKSGVALTVPAEVTMQVNGTSITIEDGATLNIAGKINLYSADATITAPAGLTVTTSVANSIVKYVDGAYTVKAIVINEDLVDSPAAEAIKAAMAEKGVTEIKSYTITTKGAPDTGAEADEVAAVLEVFEVTPTVEANGVLTVAYEFGISAMTNNGEVITITAGVTGAEYRAGVEVAFYADGDVIGTATTTANSSTVSITDILAEDIKGKKITVKAAK